MNNTLEILYNPRTITKVYSQILDNTNDKWDFYADINSLTVPFEIAQVKRAIMDAKNRGVRFRLVTEITKGNITFCKEVTKVAEIRHLEGIRGNFGVSDREYISTSGTISTSDIALSDLEEMTEAEKAVAAFQHAVYSNVKEDIQQHQYLFEILWIKAIPAENRTREIEEGIERIETIALEDSTEIAKRIKKHIESSNEIKILFQAGGLQLIYNNFLEPYKKVLDCYKKGKHKGIKYITTINKENQELAKLFLNEGVQVRHTKNLTPLNFSISNKEFQGTAEKLEGGKMVENLLVSTESIFINHYNSIFEQLWDNSMDAKDRINDINEGVDLAEIEVIPRSSRARRLYLELVKNAKEEILFIFPTSNAFIRQEKMGAIPLAIEAATEKHNVSIRILVPYSELVEQGVQALVLKREEDFTSHDLNITVRYIEHTSDVKATVLVIDRNASLVMELRDDSKSTFDEAIGLSTYSNSRPGVLSYVSIFESLWNQAKLYEELKKHNKMQQEFINIAAHELRTPAQSILGYAELAKTDPIYIEQQIQPFIDVVYRNAIRIHKLTKDILDVTRIESQTLRLNKKRFNLKDVITTVLDDIQAKLVSNNSNKVRLVYETKIGGEECDGDDDNIFIVADKDRITQVISNLLDNALKFTNQGLIYIAVGRTKERNEEEEEEEEILVTVRDTGSGIDPEIFPRLFTKFSSRSFTGTGLGLFICKNIVEAHGGKIWAKNNNELMNSGSTFYFSLPLPK